MSYPCVGPIDSTVLRALVWFLIVDFRFMDEYFTEDCPEAEEVAKLVLLTIVVFLVSLVLILAFICRFK